MTVVAPLKPTVHIGLMSGTSLDGVDGVLARFSPAGDAIEATLAAAYVPFPEPLREELMALQAAAPNEIEREALAANALAMHYADCVRQLLLRAQLDAAEVGLVGVHGQTVRHRPELGFTRQTNNPALLAELCGIDVVADFRSRDIAAGGQGAPLVPAFHRAIFGSPIQGRVVVNIGGIANISILPAGADDGTSMSGTFGFDTGPGNVLMDAWIKHHHGRHYDANGDWAASGQVHPALLRCLHDEPFFRLAPPKSSGRDLFHLDWLAAALARTGEAITAVDIQATLTALTAESIAQAITAHAPHTGQVYVCGGGAENGLLMTLLEQALGNRISVQSTAVLGVAPNQVEALAFAWLARRFELRLPGNLPAVTGARGPRVLGALYPA